MDPTRKRLCTNLVFFVTFGIYIAAGAFLNLSYVFSLSGLERIWRPNSYIVNLIMGIVGFSAAAFLFLARSRVGKESVERTVLLLIALTGLFFGAGGFSMGVIEGLGGGEAFKTSAFVPENIFPPLGFLFAVITGVWAVVLLVKNSYLILSKAQLYITGGVALAVLVILGTFLFFIADIDLEGYMKIASLFFAAVCLVVVSATSFVIMAFGKGKARSYWISMALGIMLIALSGLCALFCYAIDGKWVGMALLGFTAALAFLALAGFRRWQRLI
ncbi:MAG: hypothetical protein JW724_01270 [Candidatus Altiarchaeota archaeon]|nr:hypothetical protein [Candidatus Altiarchaeota archaeon]